MKKFLDIMMAVMVSMVISGCETTHSLEEGVKALRGERIETAIEILGPPSGSFPTERGTAYVWSTEPIDFSRLSGRSEPPREVKSLFQLNVNGRGRISGWKLRQTRGELDHIRKKLSDYVDSKEIQ